MIATDVPTTVRRGLSGFGGQGAHGGLIAGLTVDALGSLVPDDRPARSLTLHLLRPVMPGDLLVRATSQSVGRTITGLAALLVQEDEVVGTASALFGRATTAIQRVDVGPPDVPAPQECRPLIDKPVPEADAGLAVEHRPAAPPLPLSGAETAVLRVWMRPVDNRPIDVATTAFLADSAPPGLFAALTEYVPMPSAEIAIHFGPAAHAARTRWALGVVRHLVAAEGYTSEDVELWSPDGELLAVSRQLRRILGA